jgi:hypothetical protein
MSFCQDSLPMTGLPSGEAYELIDRRRAPAGSIQYLYTLLDLALVEAVEGNADEAMAGATVGAVECLRENFEEPSYSVIPEPILSAGRLDTR